MKHSPKPLFIVFITCISLFFGCGSSDEKDSFSSVKSLYVDYLNSYTSGIVSCKSDIKVRFARKVEEAQAGEKAKDGLFDFEPSIAGQAFWEDAYTLVFKPDHLLKDGAKYKAKIKLDRLFDTPDEKKEFRFTFQIMKQNYEVQYEGIRLYNQHDLSKVKLTGFLQTADFAENSNVEKILTAQQNGKNRSIVWDHGLSMNRHGFTIEQVERKEIEDKVHLKWTGKPINLDVNNESYVTIPSLDDYSILSANLVRGEESYISVLFTDPVLENQVFNGLVQINDSGVSSRLVVNLNEVKVFPGSKLTGDIKLRILKDIKNAAGYKLKDDYETIIELTQQKPEVRIAHNQKGVIMPGSEGLIMPFEAISLKAVDVTVVRIFADNVLQYLQVNNLGDDYQLNRVGRPVARKTIPLNTSGVVNLHDWNRYTLDLSDIMKAEPGAIYQIKLSFKKAHSLFYCGTEAGLIEEEESTEENWNGSQTSYEYDDYDDYDYYDDYDWQERENPCNSSYYRNKYVTKILLSSDLGLIAKKSDKGNLHVFVSNLLDTKPQGKVTVEVYDFQQQLIANGITSSEGKVEIPVNGVAFALIAKKDSQVGYLKLVDGNVLSVSNFDVSGQTIKEGIKGFLYGERGVWRPGDTLHLTFILEDKNKTLPKGHPVVLEIFNPKGQLAFRKVNSSEVGDMYSFKMNTATDALTGNWQAKVKVGGSEFKKTLKIETVKPNRLKLDLKFGRDRFSVLDKEIAGNLNIRWLHGAKGQNLRAMFEMVLSPVKTTFKSFPNHTFDDPSKEYYAESQVVFDGRVDAEGYARVNLKIEAPENAPGALNAVFKGKAFEEGGDFSIDQFNIPFYPYSSFVGIKIPQGDKRGVLVTGEDHVIDIASVDANGNLVGRQGIKVEVYKLDWRWWWNNSYEDLSNYVGRSYHKPVTENYINTVSGKGSYTLRIDQPEWGRYYIKVTDPVSGHAAGGIAFVDWPGWAGNKKGDLAGASMLDFSADKEEYKVGEKIKLTIPSSPGGRALVSLETGSRILQTFWVDTEAGNTKVEFEATNNMTPNVYANIALIQPHANTLNDLPIRMYGIKSLGVVDPETRLQPVVKLPQELRPEEIFTVSVNEQNGKAMAYTIAVVEEGLLDITRFKTPDPWQSFYAREALGIKTWDIYNDVMGAYGGNLERLLAIGGDNELKPADEKEVNRFKPVVKHLGPFYLEAGKSASNKISMPQYIGAVRTMVVASGNGAYGFAEQSTPVKQPLMVLATLPRVAGPGEDIVLPVNVFTMNPQLKQVKIEVKSSGKLKVVNATQKTINFDKPGDQVVYFSLKADEALGNGKVIVTAVSGNVKATYDVEMNIRAANPMFLDIADKLLTAQKKHVFDYNPLGIAGTNDGVIELSSMPPLNLEQRLQYLIQYPHGCVEQTTSAVFAQLYLEKLMKLDDKRKVEVEKNINAAISSLKAFQVSSGGFAYWPGNESADPWGSNYAGHFLLEAKNKGYMVSEGLMAAWITYQQQQADQWSPQSTYVNDELIQAYRLHTLALAGKPAMGAMNRMKERNLSAASQWRLALAYASAGHSKEAEKIVENLSTEVREYRELSYTYGSQQRDEAMILETLSMIGKKEQA
ncbi:MAG: MG2 domain-containing protein, partial [Bacteroidota bacterium]|nr:MG2 domain-containing protein [Bacteroidota bacterium]